MIQERKDTRTQAADEELVEVLTAISVVSMRLARKLALLAGQSKSMEGEKTDEQKIKKRMRAYVGFDIYLL